MAVTSMWAVKSRLDHVIDYVEDKDKTISKVIDYAIQDGKTNDQYISCINCYYDNPYGHMMKTKELFNDHKQRLAYHGYQSFKPGEGTPDMIHEIGVKTARELFGDKFEVVVTTHLDKKYYHNHFIVNATSFVDGKRFCNTKHDRYLMRTVSDRLCKEYGLSVIENPKRGKAKHYGEWKAEKDGRPTWRGIIKADVDEAVSKAVTDKQFFYLLRQKGYTIKQGKDITVRPQGKERGMKLARNLGDEYSYDAICKKILNNTRNIPPEKKEPDKVIVMKLHGPLNKHRKYKGIRALYFQYCFKLGILPKNKSISPARLHFLLKEDLAKLDNINKETKLLCINKIDTSKQLFSYQNQQQEQMNSLISKRKHMRYKLRSVHSEDEKSLLKSEISKLTAEIGKLRKEVILCDHIAKRSEVIKEKLEVIKEDERKEESKIEHRRRSRRSSH